MVCNSHSCTDYLYITMYMYMHAAKTVVVFHVILLPSLHMSETGIHLVCGKLDNRVDTKAGGYIIILC